jgi:hypothetical protein
LTNVRRTSHNECAKSNNNSQTHQSNEAHEEDPKRLFRSHRRPITEPQHNQSAGNEFSYRQGMEQLAPALHPQKSMTKGRSNRGQFRTLGNAKDTSYDRRNDIKLQKIDE